MEPVVGAGGAVRLRPKYPQDPAKVIHRLTGGLLDRQQLGHFHRTPRVHLAAGHLGLQRQTAQPVGDHVMHLVGDTEPFGIGCPSNVGLTTAHRLGGGLMGRLSPAFGQSHGQAQDPGRRREQCRKHHIGRVTDAPLSPKVHGQQERDASRRPWLLPQRCMTTDQKTSHDDGDEHRVLESSATLDGIHEEETGKRCCQSKQRHPVTRRQCTPDHGGENQGQHGATSLRGAEGHPDGDRHNHTALAPHGADCRPRGGILEVEVWAHGLNLEGDVSRAIRGLTADAGPHLGAHDGTMTTTTSLPTKPRELVLASAVTGAAALSVAAYQVLTPGSPTSSFGSLSDWLRDLSLLAYLVSAIVAVTLATRDGLFTPIPFWLIRGGYVLITLGATYGLIAQDDPDWFFFLAGPGLLASAIGHIWFAFASARSRVIPLWAALLAGVGGPVAILAAEFGSSILIGAFWLWVAFAYQAKAAVG